MQYDISNYELLKSLLESIPQDDSCIEWPRGRNAHGYGQLQTWNPAIERLAHRAAYVLAVGPIPDGLDVLHKCDNPPCFRPSHLFTGTTFDNMRDCASKGRSRNQSTLSVDEISKIRAARSGGAKQSDLAIQFNLSQSAISNIVRGRYWRSVEGEIQTKDSRGRHDGVNAKLTADIVREIRILHRQGITQSALGARFGVLQTTISRIVLLQSWKRTV